MSDAAGWMDLPNGSIKTIGEYRFSIYRYEDGWHLYFCSQYVANRPTLRECQILAHDTARLWAGETE